MRVLLNEYQLSLANREVPSVLFHVVVQFLGEALYILGHVNALQ